MPLNPCSYVWLESRWPNGRIFLLNRLKSLAPRDTCMLLASRGVTSIWATCQTTFPFKHFDVHTYALYRGVTFWVSSSFFLHFLFIACTLFVFRHYHQFVPSLHFTIAISVTMTVSVSCQQFVVPSSLIIISLCQVNKQPLLYCLAF